MAEQGEDDSEHPPSQTTKRQGHQMISPNSSTMSMTRLMMTT